jgi:hypothetical protein
VPQFRTSQPMELTLGLEDDSDRFYRQCVVHVVNTSFRSCVAPEPAFREAVEFHGVPGRSRRCIDFAGVRRFNFGSDASLWSER